MALSFAGPIPKTLNPTRRGLIALLLGSVVALVQVPQISQADAVGTGGLYVPITPAVLVDTTTGVGGSSAPFAAGQARAYQVAGASGIPVDASGILVSLAALSTTASDNYAMIGPDGTTLPGLSSLRYDPETTPRSNTAAIPVGSNGKIKLINKYGTSNLRVSVMGYFSKVGASGPAPGGFIARSPQRIVDTTTGAGGVPIGQIPAGYTRTVQVTGASDTDLPTDASAIFASVTVTGIDSDGDVRLYAADKPMPTVSTLDYSRGGPEQNSVMVPLSATGAMKITNVGSYGVNLSVDVQGYVSSNPSLGGGFTPITRTTVFNSGTGSSRLGPGEQRDFTVGGVLGTPDFTAGVMLTAVAASYSTDGFIEIYAPTVDAPPGLGDVHFHASDDGRENSSTTVVQPDGSGQLTVRNTSSGPVEVRINMQGWFAAPPGGPDDDPTEPNAPAMTAYGVNEYELDDIQSIAADDGITLQAALDRYGWQSRFMRDLSAIESAYPESYSVAITNPIESTPSAVIKFKGPIPSNVASMVSDIPVPVTMVPNAPFTATEMETLAGTAAQSLTSQGGSGTQVLAGFDPDTYQLEANVYIPDANVRSARTPSSMRADVRNTLYAEQPASQVPDVTVTSATDPVIDLTTLRGGVKIGRYLTAGIYTSCTSAFPVVDVNNSTIKGLVTAKHCDDNFEIYSIGVPGRERRVLKSAERRTPNNLGDIQFHRTRGEAVGKSFYYHVGLRRAITGVGTVNKGDKVCLFGRASLGYDGLKKTCSIVRRTGQTAAATLDGVSYVFNGMVLTEQAHSRHGDSGGPGTGVVRRSACTRGLGRPRGTPVIRAATSSRQS